MRVCNTGTDYTQRVYRQAIGPDPAQLMMMMIMMINKDIFSAETRVMLKSFL
jgi:hypothetical protein